MNYYLIVLFTSPSSTNQPLTKKNFKKIIQPTLVARQKK